MPSPFPGMDPYLEGDMWQEFHETLASAIRAQLMPRLTPKYVALLAKRYTLDRPALGVFDAPPPRIVYPDVHVVAPHGTAGAAQPTEQVTLAEPAIELASFIEVPQLSIEIRDVAQRRLVTVIEILSPANKYGEGAREYHDRRTEILRTEVHLLELDLIRQGARIPLAGEPPRHPTTSISAVGSDAPSRRSGQLVFVIGCRGCRHLYSHPIPTSHSTCKLPSTPASHWSAMSASSPTIARHLLPNCLRRI